MASSPCFSQTFTFTSRPRTNLSSATSSSSSLSCKTPYGSSRSSFFQNGLPIPSQALNFHGVALKTRFTSVNARAATEKSIYDFTVKDIDRNDVSLSKFKGKVLLVVNVASKCGLTTSNYTELAKVYAKYKAKGFEVLAFPCNQFGFQEPGSNSEIKNFACSRFKAEYPIFDKVDVNGPFTEPVYSFLKSSSGGFLGDLVKWNFEKFLVNKEGKVVERYPPTTSPLQIEKDIEKLLAAA